MGPKNDSQTESRQAAPFHLLVKPAGASCNLRCGYCFYLRAGQLYPDPQPRMAPDVLEQLIEQWLRAQPGPEAWLTWQGGEPTLMGLSFYRRAMELAHRHRRPGQSVRFALQTNGLLLDEEWCRFLAEHDVLVGLSLDGPPPLHDHHRVDGGGHPTFDRVMAPLRRLQAHGVEVNLLVAVHRESSREPAALYRFLRDTAGARFIQFIPVVERTADGTGVRGCSVEPEDWGRFLVGVFNEWVYRDVGRVFVQAFDAALACWAGLPPGLCLFTETCGDALVLEHNGDLYSCDHFVQPDHLLGNIMVTPLEKLVQSCAQRRFGRAKRGGLPRRCRACDVLFACRGECPRNRFVPAPDGEPGLNYLCAGYLTFFRHIHPPMRAMAALLRRQEPPSRIMELLGRDPRRPYPPHA